jgi:hypothetical protein
MIEKIKKLFALAANEGASSNEAATAMKMANALLQKHAIEKHQLRESDDAGFNFRSYPVESAWVKSVIGTVTRLYNCRAIFDYNWPKPKTVIIGTDSNRITALIVIEQLIKQIQNDTKGENAAFKNGAALGLQDVCQKIIRDRATENDGVEAIPGTGIMVLDIEKQQKMAVDEFINENFSNLKSAKRGRASSEGRAYGGGLNPGARMNGSGQRRLS